MAVGIGVNTTIFSFLSAIYLRTLPVRDSQRLLAIYARDVRSGNHGPLSAPEYAHYREHASSFSGLAAQDHAWAWLTEGERSVEWEAGRV
jgi:hypothetical protein